MNHRTSILSRRNLRAYAAAFISYVMLAGQFAPLALAAGPKSPARPAAESSAPAPRAAAPMPAPMPFFAPAITATKVDAWDDSVIPNGKAEPGQTITYTVTINNTGPDPATGVVFTDNVDTNTSLVPGSVQTQPIATGETLTAFGNVRISTANGAPNLLANDCDPDDTTPPCNTNLTASGPTTGPTNGQAVVNSDGTFSYNPNPGFTGSDSFTYTVRDTGPDTIPGNADDKTDTATASITVGPTLIWFIDNTAAGGGDGRITTPFNSIAAFNATAADDPGDIIFIHNGTGSYSGGITLLNTQKLIGQGFSLATETGTVPTGSDPLPAAGSTPTIDNAGSNIITLGQNNTLRGFNTGNSGAAGTDISGTSFGTLTVSNLSLNGDGRALNLTTGTLAATVGNISASNTGSLDGLTLNGVGGSLTVSGTTSITNPGGDGIDISNAPAGHSFNFGTATVSKNAAGTGVTLATNAGTTAFTSLTVSNSSGAGIITNNGGTLNAPAGSITTTGTGVAASFTNTALGLAFTSVSSNGGANGLIFSGGSGTFTSGTTNLQNNAGIGLLMSSSAVVAGFGNTTVNSSAGDAVDLSSNTGNITFADLDMSPDAGLRGLDAQNNTGTITATSGDITTSGGGTASAVFVDGPAGRTPIDLTFTTVTTAGVGSGSASVSLVDTSGTKFQVTGTTQINTRSGRGVFVDNATTSTVQFATVNIPNPSNAGGNAFQVEDSSSAVTVATVAISDPFITSAQSDGGGDGRPDTDGDGDGIFLRGNSGLFTLNGGTISNPGNDGIDARSSRIAISGVTITNPGQDVTGATGEGFGGHGIFAMDLTGTNTISGTTISGFNVANRDGLLQTSNTGTMTLTITGTTFQNSTGNAGISALSTGTANVTLTVGGASSGATNCTFSNISASAIVASAATTGTLNTTIQNSTFQNAPTNGKTNLTGGTTQTAVGSFNILNNTFTNIFRTASTGEGAISLTGGNTGGSNTFAVNITGNTMNGIGANSTACGAGATFCAGPLFAILVFVDGNTDTNGTININNNIVANAQQSALHLDMANATGGGVDAKVTGNCFGKLGTPGNCSGADAPVGQGSNSNVTLQNAARVFRRRIGGQPANVLFSNNVIRNGNAGSAVTTRNGAGLYTRTEADTTMSITVSNNNVDTLNTNPDIFVESISPTVGDPNTQTMCADLNGNAVNGGSISLTESEGTLNVEQASSAAVSAANGGATVNVTGAVAFGITCATPPAAPESDTSDSGLGQDGGTPLGAPTSSPSDAVPAVKAPRPTIAPRPATAPKVAAPKAVRVEAKRDAGTTFRYAAADTSAPLNPATEVSPAPAPKPEPLAQRRKVAKPVLTDDPGGPNGSGGTVSVNIGTLAPSDSVTITFQVVIDNPYSGGPNVSNQGTVSGTNFTTVNGVPTSQPNTDDPDVAGAANPTLTPINAVDIRINDAKVAEPSAPNTIDMVFTVALSQPAGGTITVNFATADNTATAGTCGNPGADYVSTSGQVSFTAGQQVKTINVPVCSDAEAEGDETFFVNLSGNTSGTLVDSQGVGTITTNTAGTFLISELRTSGPGGLGDDFVEFYNNSNAPLTIAASDASAGYGIYKIGATCNDTPVLIGTIPNGTVIPARGHYLLVGSQYSLANYGGTGAAAGNLTMSTDVESDHNVGVFSTSNVANISSANRLDAVGFGTNTGAVCDLLREPSNLGAVSGSTTEHTFFRNMGQAAGGNPKDTNDNAADFLFADTQGTFISGIPQKLGAPGPENIASPIRRDTTGVGATLLDGSKPTSAVPNRSRSFTMDAPNNSSFGTLTVRRRVFNNTGGNVTRLRFRIVEMTTFPVPPGSADLRARTGVVEASVGPINDPTTCAASGAGSPPCNVTVQPTTLETPPNQPNGGGINSTLSAGTITLGTPLANGASLNVNFLLGIQQTGTFRFLIIIEALP
ncbi:MAG TPA: Calx-beta domain-containing protein [Pyrinomonadaceae bacterium]